MSLNSPYWFEVAVVCGLTCIGSAVLSGFAQYESKWRRILKLVIGVAIAVAVSATVGRPWFFALLGALAVFLVVIHGWWLPRHGVNGLTAEPKEKYFALRRWKVK